LAALTGILSGRVQGVGFRYFIKRLAGIHEISGYAKNLADGRLEFLLQGDATDIDAMLVEIRRGPEYSHIDDLTLSNCEELTLQGEFQTY